MLGGLRLKMCSVLSQYPVGEPQHDFQILDVSFHARTQMPSVEPVHFDGFAQRFELLLICLYRASRGACVVAALNDEHRGFDVFGIG